MTVTFARSLYMKSVSVLMMILEFHLPAHDGKTTEVVSCVAALTVSSILVDPATAKLKTTADCTCGSY